MPGGLQLKKAQKIVENLLGPSTSSIGAEKANRDMYAEHKVPKSRNSDRSKMRPDDSSVGIHLW